MTDQSTWESFKNSRRKRLTFKKMHIVQLLALRNRLDSHLVRPDQSTITAMQACSQGMVAKFYPNLNNPKRD